MLERNYQKLNVIKAVAKRPNISIGIRAMAVIMVVELGQANVISLNCFLTRIFPFFILSNIRPK
jgi:hypothetical protein